MIIFKRFISLSVVVLPVLAYAQDLGAPVSPVLSPSENQLIGPVIDLATIGNPTEEVIEEVLFEQEDIMTTYQYWGQTSNSEKIKDFLSSGQNVNYDFFEGNNLILLSSMRKNLDTFNLSLSYKANISHKNNEGKNLLHYVFSDFNESFFNNLTNKIGLKKIDELSSVKDKSGATPTHYYFLSSKKADDKLINDYMLNNINAEDKKGLTPGHYALNSPDCMNLNSWLKAGGDISKKNEEDVSLEDLMFQKCSIYSVIKNFSYLSDNGKSKLNDICAKIGFREELNEDVQVTNQINYCVSKNNI